MHEPAWCIILGPYDELVFTKYIPISLRETSIFTTWDGPICKVWTYFSKLFLILCPFGNMFVRSLQFLMSGPWDMEVLKLWSVTSLSKETFRPAVMYWSLLTPAIIHNNAPGVCSSEYPSILLLFLGTLSYSFLLSIALASLKFAHIGGFSNEKNTFLRCSGPH